MAEFNVQRAEQAFGAAADTLAPSITTVGSLTRAFGRLTNVLNANGGLSAGSTTTYNNDDLGATALLTGTSTLTLERLSTGNNSDFRHSWEIIEYTGSLGDPNEIRVLRHEEITLGVGVSQVDSPTVNGWAGGNADQIVPFICGVRDAHTGAEWDRAQVSIEMVDTGASTWKGRFRRSDNSTQLIVTWAAVEMRGSNWEVEKFTDTLDNTTQTATLSVATGDWSTKFVVASAVPGASGGSNQRRLGFNVFPGSSTQVKTKLSGNSATTGETVYGYVCQNANITVRHFDSIDGGETDLPAGGGTQQLENFTLSPAVANVDETFVLMHATTDANDENYPQAWWDYRLTSTSNVRRIRGRSGVASEWSLQVIELTTDSASPDNTSNVPLGTLSITGFVPTIDDGKADQQANIPLGQLTITGLAPEIDDGNNIGPYETNLVLLHPGDLRGATISGTGAATGFPIGNVLGGDKYSTYKTNASVTTSQIDFDLGSGNTLLPNYCVIGRAQLLTARDSGNITINVLGDDNPSFSSPDSFTSSFGLSNLKGPGGEDFILETPFTTAFRYFRIELVSTLSFQHEIAQAWLGAWLDFGRDPIRGRRVSRSEQLRTRRRPSFNFNFEWRGIPDAKRRSFQSLIGRNSDAPVFIYNRSGANDTTALINQELVHCVTRDVKFTPIRPDSNKVSITFREVI